MGRLTRKNKLDIHYMADEVFYENDKPQCVCGGKVIDKLGKLEDILEFYDIESLEHLKSVLENSKSIEIYGGIKK